MRKLFFCILLTVALLPAWASAADCVVVQSSGLAPYEEAWRGFASAWAGSRASRGPKTVAGDTVTYLRLDGQDFQGANFTESITGAEVVVAIGDKAFDLARKLRQGPIVYLLVPEPGKPNGNITGISMQIPPGRQLAAIAKALPQVKNLGALYHPQHSGTVANQAVAAAGPLGLKLVTSQITSPAEVPEALDNLVGRINAYLLLPCPLLSSPQFFQKLKDFSIANRIPILGFSERHLKIGAGLVVGFNLADMGAQAARLAEKILAGSPVGRLPIEAPRQIRVLANRKILNKMGVPLNEEAVDQFYEGSPGAP